LQDEILSCGDLMQEPDGVGTTPTGFMLEGGHALVFRQWSFMPNLVNGIEQPFPPKRISALQLLPIQGTGKTKSPY